MIKLNKRPEPQILRDNRASWEQALRDHETNGTEPSKAELNRYGHKDIKSVLLAETNEKCAYCESIFRHVYPGDIEHVTPKRNGIQFRFAWENLTIACSTCNTCKGVKQGLVDPYDDDPEALFQHAGPAILPDPASNKATATEAALSLNRHALVERRTERLKALHRILKIALDQTDQNYREILLDELRVKEIRDDAEFAAMSRWYVKDLITKGVIAASAPPTNA
ncbi:HNH endonuclease [Bradyrhizobium sp. CCBAU 51627]|uniref:HNH endonuclease n=1 Tax=Bradyrhizobium sp. CCBAU 51627 TaxID=1325088 RepID=UPI002304E7F3|nr:HNH endonuclease signature motif containing protein [Bradyrhizobium sp. CCBAU 51627]